jgi:peptidoglycan-associated lipoprotein
MKTFHVVIGAILACAGCASAPKPEPVSTEAKAPPAPTAASGPSTSLVHVDSEIARACNLPEPRFAFDSSSVSPDPSLDALATCFSSGPMKGRKMHLVGHADPRGETEYNFALGQRRAGSVAGYLERRGLPDSRLSESSRGELDATGTDETSWARDRRVDVTLAD